MVPTYPWRKERGGVDIREVDEVYVRRRGRMGVLGAPSLVLEREKCTHTSPDSYNQGRIRAD